MQPFRGMNLESWSTEFVGSVIILVKNHPFCWHCNLCVAAKVWKGFPLSQVCIHPGKQSQKILFIKVWYSDVLSSAYPDPMGRMLENSDPAISISGICQGPIQAICLRWQFGFRYQTSSSRCLTEGIQSSDESFSKFWVQLQNFFKFWSSPM